MVGDRSEKRPMILISSSSEDESLSESSASEEEEDDWNENESEEEIVNSSTSGDDDDGGDDDVDYDSEEWNESDEQEGEEDDFGASNLDDDDDALSHRVICRLKDDSDLQEELSLNECRIYLRKHGLRISGTKVECIERIKDHWRLRDGNGEALYPRSSFNIDCTGDVCKGDVVLFRQRVHPKYDKVTRRRGISGKRTVAGRIVKESYGAAKQQHTFTIEVLWSKGVKVLPPLFPLLVRGRNLYRWKTSRQPWNNEKERLNVLGEKHKRGAAARLVRALRQAEPMKKRKNGSSTKRVRKELISGAKRQKRVHHRKALSANPHLHHLRRNSSGHRENSFQKAKNPRALASHGSCKTFGHPNNVQVSQHQPHTYPLKYVYQFPLQQHQMATSYDFPSQDSHVNSSRQRMPFPSQQHQMATSSHFPTQDSFVNSSRPRMPHFRPYAGYRGAYFNHAGAGRGRWTSNLIPGLMKDHGLHYPFS